MEILCDRQKTLDAAKKQAKKYANYLKGRIS